MASMASTWCNGCMRSIAGVDPAEFKSDLDLFFQLVLQETTAGIQSAKILSTRPYRIPPFLDLPRSLST